jgi:hypothetical protein
MNASLVKGHYEQMVDRESAYEKLTTRTDARTAGAAPPMGKNPPAAATRTPSGQAGASLSDLIFGSVGPRGGKHEGILESAARSAARSVGSGMGRTILRGVLGGLFGGRR